MPDRGFPGPYTNTIKENDPLMKRVPSDTMDIGARPSGMPKDKTGGEMKIDHVGGKVG